uniref:Uncharacterized protein n=1 Tax=Eptatretus burgeri TaxID=7764 RepID=A0A8C4Q6W9_EPTBU
MRACFSSDVSLHLVKVDAVLQCTSMGSNFSYIHSWDHSVFGILSNNTVVRLCNGTWFAFTGSAMQIVKSGPSGLWGIDTSQNLYTFDGQKWWFMQSNVKECETNVENTIFWIDGNEKVHCAKRNEQKPFVLAPTHVFNHEIKTMTCSATQCFALKKSSSEMVFLSRTCPLIERHTGETNVPINRMMAMPNGTIFGLDHDGYLYVRNGGRRDSSWSKRGSIHKIRHASVGANILWITHRREVKACNVSFLLM